MEQKQEVSFLITFRNVGLAYSVMFIACMVVGGIITFTATRYHEDNDKIYAFYDTFNPCIFFDHYPASVLSLSGITLDMVCSLLFTGMMFVYSYICLPFPSFAIVAVGSVIMWIGDILFPNVFAGASRAGPAPISPG